MPVGKPPRQNRQTRRVTSMSILSSIGPAPSVAKRPLSRGSGAHGFGKHRPGQAPTALGDGPLKQLQSLLAGKHSRLELAENLQCSIGRIEFDQVEGAVEPELLACWRGTFEGEPASDGFGCEPDTGLFKVSATSSPDDQVFRFILVERKFAARLQQLERTQ